MDILIPISWLKDYLKTSIATAKLAEYLTLCGPSVEKIEPRGKEEILHIEITTNRVDEVGIYGIAREAFAILKRHKIKVSLKPITFRAKQKTAKSVDYLKVEVDHNLCPRFSAVLIKNITIKDSPDWLKKRLELVNLRPINNVVDVSNYLMHELGQPIHTFDYDKIGKQQMLLRQSQKGETVTTLDGKRHKLSGGDIVIEDGNQRLIDLCGIMGGLNSAIDNQTKNVLLFVQTYNPNRIRRTSMSLAHRTEAAVIFEKDLDPELVEVTIRKTIDLLTETAHGTATKEILDIYPKPYKAKNIKVDYPTITNKIGLAINQKVITESLTNLGFKPKWVGKTLTLSIPSYRNKDIQIKEDIIEEIARLFGYHNLPSQLMEGPLPTESTNPTFDFEMKIKQLLKELGGCEVMTQTLVAQKDIGNTNALKLANPLGFEGEYLRNSLRPSLSRAVSENQKLKEPIHLFEIANIFIPNKDNLPNEKLTLAGIFGNYDYQKAKGVIETFIKNLNIEVGFLPEDSRNFVPGQRTIISTNKEIIGQFGSLEKNSYLYYEFEVDKLLKHYRPFIAYQPIAKYPPQIEDLTISFPEKTKIGEVIQTMKSFSDLIDKIELIDLYQNAYTFRLWYQHPTKTLTDKEVQEIRNKLLYDIKVKFGGLS